MNTNIQSWKYAQIWPSKVKKGQKWPKMPKNGQTYKIWQFLSPSFHIIPRVFFVDSNINFTRKKCGRVKISNFCILGGYGYPKWPPLGQKMIFWGPKKISKIFFRKFIPKHDVWYQNQPSIICRCRDMAIQNLEVPQKLKILKSP